MQSLDLDVLNNLHDWLRQGHRVWLVAVTRTFGASPRPPGSLLAMRDDGIVIGSVSGGCIEDDLVLRCNEFVGNKPIVARYGINNDEARNFGLPCGGELEVIIEPGLDQSRVDALLKKIAGGALFMREVDLTTGAWQFRNLDDVEETSINATHFQCLHGPRWRLLIIGASEIAVYLAQIAKTLDFAVSICEPREAYRSAWRVDHCDFLCGMPDDAVIAFKPDGRTVIVAVSHDPKLDDMALMEALKTQAHYVGAVGSIKTSNERRKRLLEFDVSASQVAKLHGPVGLAIGSRTPPEIAIAIAAELVATRNHLILSRALPLVDSLPADAA